MAVTITGQVKHTSFSQRQQVIFINYALSGTYASAFPTPFLGVPGALGSNAISAKNPIVFQWFSGSGYTYVTTITITNGVPAATTKIFTSGNTELAAGTAMPDASVMCQVTALRY